jgi:hypothetical protein
MNIFEISVIIALAVLYVVVLAEAFRKRKETQA